MAEVFVRARARRDILSNAEYLEEHGGEGIAQRFLDATQNTFEALAKMPRLFVVSQILKARPGAPSLGGQIWAARPVLNDWPLWGSGPPIRVLKSGTRIS